MQYQPLSLDQISLIKDKFKQFSSKTCDYSVGGMFMWRDFYRMEYTIYDGIIFTRLTDSNGMIYYNLPMGDELSKALLLLKKIEREEGNTTLRFCTVPVEYIGCVMSIFDNPMIKEQTDFADYLYLTNDLVELKGHKYGPQRNLIHQFLRQNPSWSFSVIDRTNIERVYDYFRKYCSSVVSSSIYVQEENRMVDDVLQNMETYGMFGGLMEVDNDVVGFSLGEIVNQTLFTHIEKADRHFVGAYQMLVNQFVRTFADGKCDYINREEDMGDLGLRRAKEAYHPICRLRKYIVEGTI